MLFVDTDVKQMPTTGHQGLYQPYASAIFGWRLGSLLMRLGRPTDAYGATANPTSNNVTERVELVFWTRKKG